MRSQRSAAARHVVAGAVAFAAALVIAPRAGAQGAAFVPSAYTFAASGCAEGQVGVQPGGVSPVRGTLLCAQGTGVLGSYSFSGLTFLALQLTLDYTRGPLVPASSFPYVNGARAAITFTGPACVVGGVCRGLAVEQQARLLTFFPDVPGAVDFGSIAFTEARLFGEYTLPTVPGFGFSSFQMDLQLTAVPEPATLALTAGGLAALALAARRRARRA